MSIFMLYFLGVVFMENFYSEAGETVKAEDLSFYCDDRRFALDFINMVRKQKRLNLKALAKIWSVEECTASRILSGKYPLVVDRFIDILNYLGYRLLIEPVEFIPEIGEPDFSRLDEVSFDIESDPDKYKE